MIVCMYIYYIFWIRVVSPRVDSPRKMSRFAPLNRYYIIIDEVFFDNILVIIYLLVVCKKKVIRSFWSTLIIYLLVVYKKNNNSFILVSGILLNTKGRIFFSIKNHREGLDSLMCKEWQQNTTKSINGDITLSFIC